MNLDYFLTTKEQADLAAIISTPGFKVLKDIAESECKKFINVLVNTDASDDAKVLANHKKAQVAAQLFSGFIERINEEISQYTNAPRPSDKPVDITKGLLDIDDIMNIELEEVV